MLRFRSIRCWRAIVVVVATCQLIGTAFIYRRLAFSSAPTGDVFATSGHETIDATRPLLDNSHRLITNTTAQISSVSSQKFLPKATQSAYDRAKTPECQQRIRDTFSKQVSKELYPPKLIGSCPTRNISKARLIGCFADTPTSPDLVEETVYFSDDNSPDRCIGHCYSLGLPYAGLQASVRCSCGYRFGRHGRLPNSRCDRLCPLLKNSTGPPFRCGGNLANAVYATEVGNPLNFASPKLSANLAQPAKIAFILSLNGRAVRQILRLFRVIYRPEHVYYVHVDVRQSFLFAELQKELAGRSNIIFAENRLATIWGGSSLLTMLMNALQVLTTKSDNFAWDFAINLSESDFPIKPVDSLAAFLGANRNFNFLLSHTTNTKEFINKQGLAHTFVECDNHMWRLEARSLPNGVRIFGASDWIIINRDFAKYVALPPSNGGDDAGFVQGLLSVFNFTLLPAEAFFHTVAHNSHFCSSIVNTNLHYINWRRPRGCRCQQRAVVDWCGCSPNDIIAEDFESIEKRAKSSQDYFARKFEEAVDQDILNLIEERILKSLPTANGTFHDGDEEAMSVFDHFWLNEFSSDVDEMSNNFILPFYEAFSLMAYRQAVLPDHKRSPECTINKNDDFIGHLKSSHSLQIANKFKGLLIEFKPYDNPTVVESLLVPSQPLSYVFSDSDFEKHVDLFSRWGHRIETIELGSSFDAKESVFRNAGSLLAVGQLSVCLAVRWVKFLPPTPNTYAFNNSSVSALPPHSISTSQSIDFQLSLTDPSGIETVRFASARPNETISCIGEKDVFSPQALKHPGIWWLAVRSTSSSGLPVRLLAEIPFPVLPLSSSSTSDSAALLSDFWRVEEVCQVGGGDGDTSPCLKHLRVCSGVSWSSYFPDPKASLMPFIK